MRGDYTSPASISSSPQMQANWVDGHFPHNSQSAPTLKPQISGEFQQIFMSRRKPDLFIRKSQSMLPALIGDKPFYPLTKEGPQKEIGTD